MHAGGVLVHFQLVVQVVKQSGCEEELLDRQHVRIVLAHVHELLVGVPTYGVGDGDLGATQIREDAFLDLAVGLCDVLDFLLALVLVAVHLEDTQNQIFVGNL